MQMRPPSTNGVAIPIRAIVLQKDDGVLVYNVLFVFDPQDFIRLDKIAFGEIRKPLCRVVCKDYKLGFAL